MNKTNKVTLTAGGALLTRLKSLGVEHIFVNSGTDFPPIIEGLAEADGSGDDLPNTVIAPHENVAMGMAHGYYFISNKAQVVAAHTNVGLANCTIGAINASTEQVPVLLMSGRTPVMEEGRFGCRTVPIGWGQEMRDQAALVREACKWDYELKYPEQIIDVVDRALAIANSEPKGPVYLSLPREVLCEPCPTARLAEKSRIVPARSSAPRAAIDSAAQLIAQAKNPIIIAQRGPSDEQAFQNMEALVEHWAIPVLQYWMISPTISCDHPMYAGEELQGWIEEADVVVVFDCLAPWNPTLHKPMASAEFIHIGQDPLYSKFPVRNFPASLCLPGDSSDTVNELSNALLPLHDNHKAKIEARRSKVIARNAERAATVKRGCAVEPSALSTKAWVSQCLGELLWGTKHTVLGELGCIAEIVRPHGHKSWCQEPHSGGLGFSFPAALGVKLAAPDRLVVATMGDGSYMFANPVACHLVAEANHLPLLLIILNNARWGAVEKSVTGLYPNGCAARSEIVPLVDLSPSPSFTKVAEASRAWARQVTRADQVSETLKEAIEVVNGGTFALVEILISD